MTKQFFVIAFATCGKVDKTKSWMPREEFVTNPTTRHPTPPHPHMYPPLPEGGLFWQQAIKGKFVGHYKKGKNRGARWCDGSAESKQINAVIFGFWKIVHFSFRANTPPLIGTWTQGSKGNFDLLSFLCHI